MTIITVLSISSVYLAFFVSSNFLRTSYVDDDNKHLFVPNEQDYFRTCLLGVFSPLFFNFVRNFLLVFPSENPLFIVLSNIFIDYYVYDWFLFLIIYFLAYPQSEPSTSGYKATQAILDEDPSGYMRSVFHIIPKQSYILAICWSLSEFILSILENLPFYNEIVPPKIGAYEEMGIDKPNELHIFSYCFHSMNSGCRKLFCTVSSEVICRIQSVLRFLKIKGVKDPAEEVKLPTKIDLSRCTDVMQRANMQQKCVQYQISDLLGVSGQAAFVNENHQDLSAFPSNESFAFDNSNPLLDSSEKKSENITGPKSDRHMEDVVFINFKDQTMHVEKVHQDDLNYGSINVSNAVFGNNKRIRNTKNSSGRGSKRSNNTLSLSADSHSEYDPIVEILKMKGKPRPGSLFTNKNVWQVKKETELLKLAILDNKTTDDMSKYNQKLSSYNHQKQILSNTSNGMSTSSANINSINSAQSNNMLQVEKNLEDELKQINSYYQMKKAIIKDNLELCNEAIRNYHKNIRVTKSQNQVKTLQGQHSNNTISNFNSNEINGSDDRAGTKSSAKSNRLSSNSFFRLDDSSLEESTYNFYRIDSVELFCKELRNFIIIIISNILTLIGEVLIFSIYLIYVPGHEKLFTPTVNYFGDKSFTRFAFMVILPFTFISFVVHLVVFFWPNLRQEYLFSNKISEFEQLWGIDDDLMNQLNSHRQFQNLDNTNGSGISLEDYTDNEMGSAMKPNKKSYNPFKWLKNTFSKSDQTNSAYGHVNKNVYNQFSNYNGFQVNSSNKPLLMTSSRINSDDDSSDYYQNVINKLQHNNDIDPLQLNSDIILGMGLQSSNIMQQDNGNSSRVFENNRRNMSIMSTNDLKLINKPLFSSNLSFKEMVLILMYRLKKMVIKWRLKSESCSFVLIILFIFGLLCFIAGVLMTLTDVFFYFSKY